MMQFPLPRGVSQYVNSPHAQSTHLISSPKHVQVENNSVKVTTALFIMVFISSILELGNVNVLSRIPLVPL